jgi:SPOR domain
VDATWSIQLGAYPTSKAAQDALYAAARGASPKLFANKLAFTVEVKKGDETKFRARMSGFTAKTAKRACRVLTRKGVDCAAVAPQSQVQEEAECQAKTEADPKVPLPRPKPIEVLMMAAANMKIEPPATPPTDVQTDFTSRFDSESLGVIAGAESNVSAKGSFADSLRDGTAENVTIFGPRTMDSASNEDLFWWPKRLTFSPDQAIRRDGASPTPMIWKLEAERLAKAEADGRAKEEAEQRPGGSRPQGKRGDGAPGYWHRWLPPINRPEIVRLSRHQRRRSSLWRWPHRGPRC